jgi:hypothetical protein
MIIESFQVENWSCIGHLAVDDLPPSGLTVLHGPNGTGKSSIVDALRACLFDFQVASTKTALTRRFPKNHSEPPCVTVVFRSGSTAWKTTKQFKKNGRCELYSRTATGEWKLESATASEVHDKTQLLAGSSRSTEQGLPQLLWLTQAKFDLPEAGKFDQDVQSRLRTVLGVLQTPLDDGFIQAVRKRWGQWYTGQRKSDGQSKTKEKSPVALNQEALEKLQIEEEKLETRFCECEEKIRRLEQLEVERRSLHGQNEEQERQEKGVQEEYTRSVARIQAHEESKHQVEVATTELASAKAAEKNRQDLERQRDAAANRADQAEQQVAAAAARTKAAHDDLQSLRNEKADLGREHRSLSAQRTRVADQLQRLSWEAERASVRRELQLVQDKRDECDKLKREIEEYRAPDQTLITEMRENRDRATIVRARLDAAAIQLLINPQQGVPAAHVAIDGGSSNRPALATGAPAQRHLVRLQADVEIPDWGTVTVKRGSDTRTISELETELEELEKAFAEGVAPYEVTAADLRALDRLVERQVHRAHHNKTHKALEAELRKLAPKGLDPLRANVNELNAKLVAPAASSDGEAEPPSNDLSLLGKLAERLQAEYDRIGVKLDQAETSERQTTDNFAEASTNEHQRREDFTKATTERDLLDLQLNQLPKSDELTEAVRAAAIALDTATGTLDASKLSVEEETVADRFEAAREAVRATQKRLRNVETEYHEIKGALSQFEGLHQDRAAAAARLEQLQEAIDREELERDAVDRLYALFDECREKRFNTVLKPIHDRVLRWMNILRIDGYHELRFSDAFLLEKLTRRGGTVEFALDEESVGTQEQIGLLVRLALGSALSTPEEPAVAVLDDPLTHSDTLRLTNMRAVLRAAAAGDSKLTPPAGPLQILIFTCHPEWFEIDGAKAIDLADPSILTRWGN